MQGISPHAPYTVSPLLLRPLVTLAHRRNMPVAMHLAESREELQFLREGVGPFKDLLEERSMWDPEAVPRGSTPHDYLRTLADAPRALVIHGNYLGRRRAGFFRHASRSNVARLLPPHARLLRARTLSARRSARSMACESPSVRTAARRTPISICSPRCNEYRSVHPDLDPHEILRMGTLAGAEALGREAEFGSITPGKFANLVAFPFVDGQIGSPDDILTGLLATDRAPTSVWLHGRRTPGHNDPASHL